MPYILLGNPAYQKYADTLKVHGFTPVSLPPDTRLNKIVNTHADTLIFTDGKTHIANSEYINKLPEELTNFFTPTNDFPHGEYPTDTVFNALAIRNHIFARADSLSPTIRGYAEKNGYTLVSVKQGYARCSTLALTGASAAITADLGMGTAMAAQGIKVFIISSGHIALEGCKYGFIGGASFVCEVTKTVYLFGDISLHPDGREIVSFIKNNGYSVICLDGALSDYGGAVII